VVVLHHDGTSFADDEHFTCLATVVEHRVSNGIWRNRDRDRHAVREGGDECD
jgi:hypothetical protein